jgi:hypothetical protein
MNFLKVLQDLRGRVVIQLLKDILIDKEKRLKLSLNMPRLLSLMGSGLGILGFLCHILIESLILPEKCI